MALWILSRTTWVNRSVWPRSLIEDSFLAAFVTVCRAVVDVIFCRCGRYASGQRRWTDRQTDRQTDTHTHTHKVTVPFISKACYQCTIHAGKLHRHRNKYTSRVVHSQWYSVVCCVACGTTEQGMALPLPLSHWNFHKQCVALRQCMVPRCTMPCQIWRGRTLTPVWSSRSLTLHF